MAETRRKTAKTKRSKTKSRAQSGKQPSNRVNRPDDIKVVSGITTPESEIHLGDSYYNMLFGTISMVVIGILTVYMATGDVGMLIKQSGFGALGIFLAHFFISGLGTKIYYKLVGIIYVTAIVLTLLLLTPLKITSNGAARWLNIGGISLQVVEVVKVAVIIVCAYILSTYAKKLNWIALTIIVWGFAAVPAVLIMKISSDLSSTLVIFLIAFVMTFVVTGKWIFHIAVGVIGIIGFYFIYVKEAIDMMKEYGVANLNAMYESGDVPYRVGRILGWLYPENFTQGFAYQTTQSVRAIGSAGFLGKGLGSTLGTEGLFAVESDFIIAQVASSFGILGLIGILALFLFIVYNIIYTATNSRKRLFDCLLCTGVATHFLFQNLINFCVATGVFPNTGIPFIFLSNGNTGLLINICEVGIVMAINRKSGKILARKGILY